MYPSNRTRAGRALGLISLLSLTTACGTRAQTPPELGLTATVTGSLAGDVSGCARVADQGTRMNFYFQDLSGPLDELKLGLNLTALEPQRLELVRNADIWPAEATWDRPGQGYGTAFRRTDGLYWTTEGTVTLERLDDDLVSGHFESTAVGPGLADQSDTLMITGRFAAPRDSLYSRWLFDRDVPEPPKPAYCR